MTRLYLVRHGEAAGGWDDPDPGLSPEGRRQAEAVADRLAPLGPLPIRVSPLRRTRETAAPLASRWGIEPVIDPLVGEVQAPEPGLDARLAWLEPFLQASWSNQPPALDEWRDRVVGHVLSLEGDAVVVSHFVAINAVVGAVTGDDRVTCFRAGNCSVTVVERVDGSFCVQELGVEDDTAVR